MPLSATIGDDSMLAKFLDEFLDLRVAAEEPVGLLLAHRPQADERLVDELGSLVPIRLEDRLEELRQFLAVPSGSRTP